MADQKTIAAYETQAEKYAEFVATEKPGKPLRNFMERLGKGAFVLDLGCGPAHHAAIMKKAGLQVDPVDASSQMVALANKNHAINARQATFDDISQVNTYDGVWANFSLLHAPQAALPGHLAQIARALKPGGLFHIGMKTGNGEHRDRLDRQYAYYTDEALTSKLEEAGFEILEKRHGEDKGLAGDVEPWVLILSRLTNKGAD